MRKYVLEIGDKEYEAELKELTKDHADIEVNGTNYHIKLKELGRKPVSVPQLDSIQVAQPVRPTMAPPKPKAAQPAVTPDGDAEGISAPLPGLILDVMVKAGDSVKSGQNVILMEAMKMENQVTATHDGTVNKVYINKGDTVEEGQLLLDISRSPIAIL
jgi:glutaconyl-CoA/methylmalonyl-CoA decarboxylase subunit gamma